MKHGLVETSNLAAMFPGLSKEVARAVPGHNAIQTITANDATDINAQRGGSGSPFRMVFYRQRATEAESDLADVYCRTPLMAAWKLPQPMRVLRRGIEACSGLEKFMFARRRRVFGAPQQGSDFRLVH